MEKILMRTLILVFGLIILGFGSVSQAQEVAVYRATFTNLTKGQWMTPPAILVHDSTFKLFTLGEEATEGLKVLAKDGANQLLEFEVSSASNVFNFISGTEVIFDKGASVEIFFWGVTNTLLSTASMLGTTNDGFFAGRGLSLDLQPGEQREYFLKVYDAGAEDNNESCAFISGPPCNNHNVDTPGNEGFVHDHPGLTFTGDLDPVTHAFASTVAKLTLLRIQ